jgi:hypothetical protein
VIEVDRGGGEQRGALGKQQRGRDRGAEAQREAGDAPGGRGFDER